MTTRRLYFWALVLTGRTPPAPATVVFVFTPSWRRYVRTATARRSANRRFEARAAFDCLPVWVYPVMVTLFAPRIALTAERVLRLAVSRSCADRYGKMNDRSW